jgi:capsular polysaccharide transport system permease protein
MQMNRELSLLHSFRLQRRVLYALLMREVITRYGRENLGVLWLVLEPMLFTLGVMALWSAGGMVHAMALPIVAFAVTGYSSVLMWRNAAGRCSVAIEANKQLLYHRNVQVIDVILVRIVLEIAGASASFIALSLFFVLMGLMSPPVDLMRVLAGWAMLAWFGGSLALLIGAGTAFSPIVERLWHPAAYLIFPMSGAAFMVDWLPAKFQQGILLVPMVNGVEMIRDGFFGSVVRTHYDIGYMAACCLVMSLAGLHMAREAGRRVEL